MENQSRVSVDNPKIPAEVINALYAGHKLEAIKLLRTARGIGLKQSKEAVDAYVRMHPEIPQPQTINGGAILFKAAMFALAVYLVYRFVF